VGLASLVLFGFYLSGVEKIFRKPYAELREEEVKFGEAPSMSFPDQIQVGEPVQILPYKAGFNNYVNVQSHNEKIGE